MPVKKPWFIGGFLLLVAALVTWNPGLQRAGHFIASLALGAVWAGLISV